MAICQTRVSRTTVRSLSGASDCAGRENSVFRVSTVSPPGSTLRPCFPAGSALKQLKHETQTKPVANAFVTRGHEPGYNERHVRRHVRAHVGIAGTPATPDSADVDYCIDISGNLSEITRRS